MGYLANAGLLLISFVFGAVLGLLFLRLLAELLRANFSNPICQFLFRATHPVVAPLHRVLPSVRRLNLAVLALALIAELVKLLLICALQGIAPNIGGLLLLAVAELIDFVMVLYMVLIIAWALLGMFAVGTSHPLVPLVEQLTRPVMRPLQKRVPTLGGIDFSPAIAILIILLARILLVQPLFDLASGMLQ
ncbi:MAG: YggT family protein [Rhodanobacteraceae bacterium]